MSVQCTQLHIFTPNAGSARYSDRSIFRQVYIPTGIYVGSLPRSITVTVAPVSPDAERQWDDLVLVLQWRVNKSDCHAVIAFSRTCNLALYDCRRVAGRPLGVSLGTCRARGCELLSFCV